MGPSSTSGFKRSRRIAAVAVLSPLALILTQGPKIPFPPLPFLTMELWEIPIYFALLYFDLKTALTIELVVYLALQILAPGVLPFGPVYNLVAVIGTIGGIQLVKTVQHETPKWILSAVAGIILRVAVSSAFNYEFIPLPYPFGFNTPLSHLASGLGTYGVLGLLALFNGVVAFYSIFAATLVVRVIAARLGRVH